jgi:hypothetical protein
MDTHVRTPIHVNSFRYKKKYRSHRRRMRQDQCAAVLRALTGAQLRLDGKTSSLTDAALRCGSCRQYVQAALILLQSENTTVLDRVLRGAMPLSEAAKQMKQVASLVHAYRTAGAADRVAFAKTIGPTTLFDGAVALAL